MTIANFSNDGAPPPRLFSVAEIATMFGRAPRTIRSWIARELFQPVKVGNAVFIPEAQIDALLSKSAPSHAATDNADNAYGNSSN
jgi:uncharacterized protein YjcR